MSGNVLAIVPQKKREIQESVVEMARDLLAQCESGEVVGFSAHAEIASGGYRMISTASNDRHRKAGILLESAMLVLSDD